MGGGFVHCRLWVPREFHGQRSLVGYNPRGQKESDTTEVTYIHTYTHTDRTHSPSIPKMPLCHACSFVSDSLQPRGLEPTRLLCPRNFPGKNTGEGCHFLLQGIFSTQGSNLVFHTGRWIFFTIELPACRHH